MNLIKGAHCYLWFIGLTQSVHLSFQQRHETALGNRVCLWASTTEGSVCLIASLQRLVIEEPDQFSYS